MARQTRVSFCGGTSLIFVLVGAALAQTYYKWTDEHGTVHLSDQPPPERAKAEQRVFAPRPSTQEPAQQPAEAANSRGEASSPQVVLAKQEVERVGPNAVRIRGELHNTGGGDAHGVAVTVKAKDVGQGNPCLERQIAPVDDALSANGKTTFEAEIADPCLFGEPPIEISVSWE